MIASIAASGCYLVSDFDGLKGGETAATGGTAGAGGVSGAGGATTGGAAGAGGSTGGAGGSTGGAGGSTGGGGATGGSGGSTGGSGGATGGTGGATGGSGGASGGAGGATGGSGGGAPVQQLPTSDIAKVDVWTAGACADPDLWKCVDDGTSFAASDLSGSFVRLAQGKLSGSHTVGFAQTPAGGASIIKVNVHARGNGTTGTLKLTLLNGTNQVGQSGTLALSDAWQELVEQFSVPAVSTLNLRVKLDFTAVNGTGWVGYSQIWLTLQ